MAYSRSNPPADRSGQQSGGRRGR